MQISVIEYLGRYTHRVAISNERILKIEEEKVTFKWRDYKDGNKMKEMTVSIEEFIRRFFVTYITTKIYENKILWIIRK